jgi:ATP-dependent RNA helicase DDX31/DBP7
VPESTKRIGKLRLASRAAGYREATPDLDDIKAGSDGDNDEDLMAAVTAAMTRDKELYQEMHDTGALGDHIADDDHFNNNNDDDNKYDDDGYDLGGGKKVVDFTTWRDLPSNLMPLRRNRKTKHEREAALQPRKLGSTVKPGQLMHAGDDDDIGGGDDNNNDGSTKEDQSLAAIKNNKKNKQDIFDTSATFASLGLSQQIADHLTGLHFHSPTLVQQHAIPPMLAGRDVLVNAPTGSGKTLAYLAPIVNQLSLRTQPNRVTRADGAYAIIISPTRELCLQVNDVLTMLVRRCVWVVGGAVHGGESRPREKARLRKGVNILVASPGRLLDHLENTVSFKTDRLEWIVLDEGDRLLDMGFEKKIAQIIRIVDERSIRSSISSKSGKDEEDSGGDEDDYEEEDMALRKKSSSQQLAAPIRRKTALFSATLHSGLDRLSALSLNRPVFIGLKEESVARHAVESRRKLAAAGGGSEGGERGGEEEEQQYGGDQQMNTITNNANKKHFDIPKTLKQWYLEVPCKLRLILLAALLRQRLNKAPTTCKTVVFMSNCDSVDFHHALFSENGVWEDATGRALIDRHHPSSSNPHPPILKLHGNMAQIDRTATLIAFTKASTGVLFCTDVAARGLDFPAISLIIQYDPPGEAEEYVHRVGRTARLGRSGEAVLFLTPEELKYLDHLEEHGVKGIEREAAHVLVNEALPEEDQYYGDGRGGVGNGGGGGGGGGKKWRPGFNNNDKSEHHMFTLERHQGAYALQKKLIATVSADNHLTRMATDAFRSFVRAYATHSTALKGIFHVRGLHLGHVAHSFALAQRPGMVGKSRHKEEIKKKRAEDLWKQKKMTQKEKANPALGGYVLQ